MYMYILVVSKVEPAKSGGFMGIGGQDDGFTVNKARIVQVTLLGRIPTFLFNVSPLRHSASQVINTL